MYALVLLVTVVIACIMLAPGVETWLNKSPFCEQINPGEHSSVHQGKDLGQQFTDFGKQLVGQASNIVVPKLPCADAIGYLAVYRICFVVAGKTFKSLPKGQLNSEWIYEVIVSPKMPTKNLKDFCPGSLLLKG